MYLGFFVSLTPHLRVSLTLMEVDKASDDVLVCLGDQLDVPPSLSVLLFPLFDPCAALVEFRLFKIQQTPL